MEADSKKYADVQREREERERYKHVCSITSLEVNFHRVAKEQTHETITHQQSPNTTVIIHGLRITCMETLLKDPPMTPAIASGLSSCRAYEPSGHINSVSSTLVREALTNSRA